MENTIEGDHEISILRVGNLCRIFHFRVQGVMVQ